MERVSERLKRSLLWIVLLASSSLRQHRPGYPWPTCAKTNDIYMKECDTRVHVCIWKRHAPTLVSLYSDSWVAKVLVRRLDWLASRALFKDTSATRFIKLQLNAVVCLNLHWPHRETEQLQIVKINYEIGINAPKLSYQLYSFETTTLIFPVQPDFTTALGLIQQTQHV